MTHKRITFWVALVLPWLLVMAFPPTRRLFLSMKDDATWHYYPELDDTFADLGRKYPHDMQVQVSVAEWGNRATNMMTTADFARINSELGKVARRFPQDPLPVANYLRHLLTWMQDARLAGDFESYSPRGRSSGAPPPEHVSRQAYGEHLPNVKPAQLQEAIALARHGQQLEPDNVYFDWVLVSLLLSAERDEAALKVLHTGSFKTRYDDHTLESFAALIHTSERAQPLFLEQKLFLCNSALNNATNRYQHAARLLSWRAWKAERSGQHPAAIALRADLARMGHLLLHDHNSTPNQYASYDIERIAWGGSPQRTLLVNQRVPRWLQGNYGAQARLLAQDFAAYARTHHNNAVAVETLRFAQDASAMHAAFARGEYERSIPPLHDASLREMLLQVRAFWWIGASLLHLAVPLACASFGMSLLLLRTAPQPDERRMRALPVLGACFALMVVAAWGAQSEVLRREPIDFGFEDFVPSWPTREQSLWGNICLIAFVVIPLLLPLLVWGAQSCYQLLKKRRTQAQDKPLSSLPRDMRPYIWAFLTVSVILSTLTCWSVAIYAELKPSHGNLFRIPALGVSIFDSEIASDAEWLGLVCTMVWLGGWLLKWRFFMPRDERPLAHGALRRVRLTLSTLLVVVSWAHLVVLCVSLIPRSRAEQRLTLILHQGIALMVPTQNTALPNGQRKSP